MPSTISAGTTAGTAIAIAGDTTGNLAFQTNGTTTAMTIDTSQNVGIGVTSISTPNSRVNTLQVGSNASGGSAELVLGHQGDGFSLFTSGGSGVGSISVAQGTTSLAEYTYQGIFKFNSGYGSVATAYGCRAWVNFNGTGTPAIRASGNVTSITDNAVGDYTINFTNAMPDANYCATLAFSREPDCPSGNIATNNGTGLDVAPTTTALRVGMFLFGTGGKDVTYINVAIFR